MNSINCLLFLTIVSVSLNYCSAVCELKWVKTDHKKIPPNSVIANTGNGLGDFYPSRAVWNGVLTPGRFKPAEERCFVTMDGKEYTLQENFEVLTNPNHCVLEWRRARDGTVPKGAVEAGVDKQGGKAYIARVTGWGGYMVGKFYKSTKTMYYGWGGAEYKSVSYELLTNVDKKTDNTLKPDCKNHKQFGHDSFVCICTDAQPCDKLEAPTKTSAGVVTLWESSALGARLKKQTLKLEPNSKQVKIDKQNSQLYIKVNRDVKHQEIFGFGGAFTDATGLNMKKMGAKLEDQLIKECFSKDGLEYNIGRIPIGGSDFSTRGYSLDDGGDDKTLKNFNLTQEDFNYKIPIIKKAKSMATHEIRFYGSPWSAPKWMKTNNDLSHCGSIKGKVGEEYWQIYAKYFIKYLEAYKAQGISHWGLTVQNEPFACQSWNSMYFSPEMMRDFIAKTLGPELERNGYGPDKLKLMILDHNLSLVKEFVSKIFADSTASKYAAGTAVHWYGHDPKVMLDEPHKQHPDKFMLATEACVEGGVKLGDWNTADLYASDILDDLLHHVIGWTDWNMALDMQGGPNWVKNFVDAPLILNPDKHEYYRQPSFYALAHFTKYLAPGSVRVDTTIVNNNNNNCLVGAFRTTKGSTVLIVVNTEDIEIDFIAEDAKAGKLITKIAPRSIVTYVYYD